MLNDRNLLAADSVQELTVPRSTQAVSWLRLLAIYGLIAIALVAYLPTVQSLHEQWADIGSRTYAHGYLIAGICLWLLFRSRLALAVEPLEPRLWALPLLIVLGLVAMLAYRAGIEIGHQLLLPAIVWLSLFAAFGWRIARRTIFPIGYLYFAISIWSEFNGALQELTTVAARFLLRITGIPAFFRGNFVEIPAGVFEIAGGCSGLHYVIVALALAALYGELQNDGWRMRIRQLLLAGVLAIASNWIRVYIIILVGHFTDMQHPMVTDHESFGWIVFAVAMIAFFLLVPTTRENPPGVVPHDQQTRFVLAPVMMTSVALIGVPLILAVRASASFQEMPVIDLPSRSGGWMGPSVVREWQPVFVGADAQAIGAYRNLDVTVEVYVASYATQRQGKELIGYENSLVAPLREQSLIRSAWKHLPLNEYVVTDRSGQQWLIWSFYSVGTRVFASGLLAQLWYGAQSLLDMPESRVIALRTSCLRECQRARETLGSFLEQAEWLSAPLPR